MSKKIIVSLSLLLVQPLGHHPGGFHAGGSGLGQAAGHARAVAHGEEAGQGGFQLAGESSMRAE